VIVQDKDGNTVMRQEDVTGTSFRTPALDKGKYIWQVVAVNANGRARSDEWTFHVNPASSLNIDDGFKAVELLAKTPTETRKPTRDLTAKPRKTRTPEATETPDATETPEGADLTPTAEAVTTPDAGNSPDKVVLPGALTM